MGTPDADADADADYDDTVIAYLCILCLASGPEHTLTDCSNDLNVLLCYAYFKFETYDWLECRQHT